MLSIIPLHKRAGGAQKAVMKAFSCTAPVRSLFSAVGSAEQTYAYITNDANLLPVYLVPFQGIWIPLVIIKMCFALLLAFTSGVEKESSRKNWKQMLNCNLTRD